MAAHVSPQAADNGALEAAHQDPPDPPIPARRRTPLPWAQLLLRDFFLDALKCPRRTTPMVVLAFISDPPVVTKILRHLKAAHRPAAARAGARSHHRPALGPRPTAPRRSRRSRGRGARPQTRGLNRNYNHTLKRIFKGTATTVIQRAREGEPLMPALPAVARRGHEAEPREADDRAADRIDRLVDVATWRRRTAQRS